MQPHEWANQITRCIDGDIHLLEVLTEKYDAIRDLADSIRMMSHLESDANRMVDDVSVGLSSLSDTLDSVASSLDGYYTDLRNALTL